MDRHDTILKNTDWLICLDGFATMHLNLKYHPFKLTFQPFLTHNYAPISVYCFSFDKTRNAAL